MQFLQLPLELLVVEHGYGDGAHGKDGVEARQPLSFDGIEEGTARLSVKVLQDVPDYGADAFRGGKRLFDVDGPDFAILHALRHLHCVDVVDAEGQHIAVIDGIDDGIGVQLVAKSLFGGLQQRVAAGTGILGKDGRARKAEQMVIFEGPGDGGVHIRQR